MQARSDFNVALLAEPILAIGFAPAGEIVFIEDFAGVTAVEDEPGASADIGGDGHVIREWVKIGFNGF